VVVLSTNCNQSLILCLCLNRNFQLLSFGEEAEEDEREVLEVAPVCNSRVVVFVANVAVLSVYSFGILVDYSRRIIIFC